VVSTIVLTVGEDFAFPTGLTIVSEISRPERIGKNMGIYNSFLQFGRAVGPIISGLAFTITLNPYLLWSITSFWGVAGAIMFFIVFRGGIRNPFQDSTPQVISGK
jgi:Major Facilitator Superfamily.